MERDKFMAPSEAKDFGIIDKILEHPLQEREQDTTSSSRLTEDSTTSSTSL